MPLNAFIVNPLRISIKSCSKVGCRWWEHSWKNKTVGNQRKHIELVGDISYISNHIYIYVYNFLAEIFNLSRTLSWKPFQGTCAEVDRFRKPGNQAISGGGFTCLCKAERNTMPLQFKVPDTNFFSETERKKQTCLSSEETNRSRNCVFFLQTKSRHLPLMCIYI